MPKTVMTVNGEININSLGTTLMHEHIYANNAGWWHCPSCKDRMDLANSSVNMNIIGELRMDPFVNKDNIVLNDLSAATNELIELYNLGGRTIVDPTNIGIGRDPNILKDISEKTKLNIVMGSGFYLEPTHPEYVSKMNKNNISELIINEFEYGVDNSGIKIGLVGEIGISKDFTNEEEKVLRGAAIAARETKLPLSVHLPGWERHGKKVLDIAKKKAA
jgi:phosphotriesterase-related protein